MMSDQVSQIAVESGRKRFVFVDALRGVAAILVVMHHLLISTVMEATLRRILPGALCAICTFGARGVQIFFVISGFVIAHSVRSIVPDLKGAGNFILRRQVRLDPPYWLMMGLALLDNFVENHVPGLVHKPLPGAAELLGNLFYLQGLFGFRPIVGVSWTLCLEIQFYLLFMSVTVIGFVPFFKRLNRAPLAMWVVFSLGLLCLLAFRTQIGFPAWFPSFWPYFALGAVCYWSTQRLLPAWAFAVYGSVFAIVTYLLVSSLMLVGLLTALSLLVAAESRKIETWGSNSVIQYLGRISYSLYLVHGLVLSAILRGGYKLTHENRWAAVGWFILAAVTAVVAADLFHRAIEVPSMRWSARLKTRKPAGETDTSLSPVAPSAALNLAVEVSR